MFDKLITKDTLENLAGAAAFKRGEAYFSTGSVGHLSDTGDKISAQVEGTETYRVELRDDDGNLGYDCTCPRAAEGHFCKHCVAVGLAWLSGQKDSRRRRTCKNTARSSAQHPGISGHATSRDIN